MPTLRELCTAYHRPTEPVVLRALLDAIAEGLRLAPRQITAARTEVLRTCSTTLHAIASGAAEAVGIDAPAPAASSRAVLAWFIDHSTELHPAITASDRLDLETLVLQLDDLRRPGSAPVPHAYISDRAVEYAVGLVEIPGDAA